MNLPTAIQEQSKQNEEFYNSLNNIEEEKGGDLSTTDPVTPTETKVEDDGYEKRFKNFKASADKTIHEQRQELEHLRLVAEQNDRLKKELEGIQKDQPKFTKEALETFSNEELEVFNNLLEQKTNGLVGEVTYLKNKLEQVEQAKLQEDVQSDYQKMKEQVAAAVPDFETIDTSPEFKVWLNGVDAYGKGRMDSLREAQAAKNIASIISYYNDFKQQQEPVQVDPRTLQQTPDVTSADPQLPNSNKRVWDSVAIQEFYKDSGLGKYTPEQRLSIEKEIRSTFYGS